MVVRKKRPRGFKKEAQGVQVSPLNPLAVAPRGRTHGEAVVGDDLRVLVVASLRVARGRVCH
jgi:hypothetical protein